MAINKVIYDGKTLVDLTADTVTADKILKGYTAHDKAGDAITGTSTLDSDTTDATASVSEILKGQTVYARGSKLTGTMANNGAYTTYIDTVKETITIPQGYHDGSGKISIVSTEQAKIIAGNIKEGVQILGVTGTLEPSSAVTAQTKTVTPTSAKQTVLPDTSYDYLSQVVVNAIPYVETANSAGGTTVTIAG